MLLLSSSTTVTSVELQERTEAYSEYLLKEGVPEAKLEPSYDRAMKGRRVPYPLTAQEWLTGYDALKSEGNHASACEHCAARAANPGMPPCPFHPLGTMNMEVATEACGACDHEDCYVKRKLRQDGALPATGDLRGTEIKRK